MFLGQVVPLTYTFTIYIKCAEAAGNMEGFILAEGLLSKLYQLSHPFVVPGWLPVHSAGRSHASCPARKYRGVLMYLSTPRWCCKLSQVSGSLGSQKPAELSPLEKDKKLRPDPAAGYQDSHAPGTSMTMGKEAYGDFLSPWSCLDSRPLWKQKWSLKIPFSLHQLPKGSSHLKSP